LGGGKVYVTRLVITARLSHDPSKLNKSNKRRRRPTKPRRKRITKREKEETRQEKRKNEERIKMENLFSSK
jgi:hypothetical protein